MTTAVTAFVCDFCVRKKRFSSKVGADRHERQCFHNPIRRACATYRVLTVEPYDSETGDGGAFCGYVVGLRDAKQDLATAMWLAKLFREFYLDAGMAFDPVERNKVFNQFAVIEAKYKA